MTKHLLAGGGGGCRLPVFRVSCAAPVNEVTAALGMRSANSSGEKEILCTTRSFTTTTLILAECAQSKFNHVQKEHLLLLLLCNHPSLFALLSLLLYSFKSLSMAHTKVLCQDVFLYFFCRCQSAQLDYYLTNLLLLGD